MCQFQCREFLKHHALRRCPRFSSAPSHSLCSARRLDSAKDEDCSPKSITSSAMQSVSSARADDEQHQLSPVCRSERAHTFTCTTNGNCCWYSCSLWWWWPGRASEWSSAALWCGRVGPLLPSTERDCESARLLLLDAQRHSRSYRWRHPDLLLF